MSGVSKYHNKVTRVILILLTSLLKNKEWEIYYEGFKVRTPDGNFFYPDVIVCKENAGRYFTAEPVLLVEVLSETTRKFDLTDKFIQYQKISTLRYYLCVEPEQRLSFSISKIKQGNGRRKPLQKTRVTLS
jgi:Uma2 family endonuclease